MLNKPHILFIPSWYSEHKGDLSGSFFREQILGLYKQNINVGIIYPDLKPLWDYKKIRIIPKVSFENDSGINTYRTLWSSWFPKIRFLQIQSYKILGYFLFKKYIKRFGIPDIIHCHSTMNAGFLAELIHDNYNIPFVITEHSTGFFRALYGNYYSDISRILNKSKLCLGVSSSLCSFLEKEISNSPKWVVHHNLVSEIFLNEEITIPKKQPFIFISISYLIKRKNTSLILKSFQRFNKTYPDSKLKIIGTGVEMKKLQKECSILGISNKVTFMGSKSRTDVVKEINSSHVFVLGSIYETFGVVFIEALALGRPVITTSCEGSEDIIDEKVGIITKQNDVEDMYLAMLEVYKNFDKYDSKKIREYCTDKFSEITLSSKLINHYKNIIS